MLDIASLDKNVLAVVTAFGGAIFGSACGAGFSYVVTSRLQRRALRSTTTDKFIDEFYSNDFLPHRISLWATKTKLDKRDTTFAHIGQGFWTAETAIGDYYAGETVNGLNEHQHITAFMGYYIRLQAAINGGRIDQRHLKAALDSEYHWAGEVLTGICVATELFYQTQPQPLPTFVTAIRTMNRLFGYDQPGRADLRSGQRLAMRVRQGIAARFKRVKGSRLLP